MTAKRLFFAQSFKAGARGALVPQPPQECRTEAAAHQLAERLAATHRGAVVVAQLVDKAEEVWGEVEILARFGTTPEE